MIYLSYQHVVASLWPLNSAKAHGRNCLGLCQRFQDKTSNIHVAFGPSISLMNIHDILNFQKRFSKVKTSMQSGKEPVPWTKVLRNSGFSLQSGKVCISDREQAETRKLLEDFMSNHNHEAVRALLEAGVSIAGLTSRGLLYLTLAVELKLGLGLWSKAVHFFQLCWARSEVGTNKVDKEGRKEYVTI